MDVEVAALPPLITPLATSLSALEHNFGGKWATNDLLLRRSNDGGCEVVRSPKARRSPASSPADEAEHPHVSLSPDEQDDDGGGGGAGTASWAAAEEGVLTVPAGMCEKLRSTLVTILADLGVVDDGEYSSAEMQELLQVLLRQGGAVAASGTAVADDCADSSVQQPSPLSLRSPEAPVSVSPPPTSLPSGRAPPPQPSPLPLPPPALSAGFWSSPAARLPRVHDPPN